MLRRCITSFALLILLTGCATRQEVRTVHVDGVEIGYQIKGQGEPLLMVMGYAGTMDAWDPVLVDRLADRYQVILFDNRNVGYSSTSPAEVTIPLMARDSLGLLKALDIDSAHVLGWSMGSIIAQEMALTRPDSVRKLTLYGSALERGPVMEAIKRFDGKTPEEFASMLFPKTWLAENPDVYSRLPSPAVPATPEAINRQREALGKWQGTGDRLSAMGKDVLLVVGEDDDITPVSQSLLMAEKIEGAWLVRFKGAGHWLMYQSPEELASAVDLFLKGRQDLLQGPLQ